MASLEDPILHLKAIFFAARTFPSNPRADVAAVLSGVVKWDYHQCGDQDKRGGCLVT